MSFDIEARKTEILSTIDKLDILKDNIERPTAIENQLSFILFSITKYESYHIGDIKIVQVKDEDTSATDKRKKAHIVSTNDLFLQNQEDDTYLYNDTVYTPLCQYKDGLYPYYTTADGSIKTELIPNTTVSIFLENYTTTSQTIDISLKDELMEVVEDMRYFGSEYDIVNNIFVPKKVSNTILLSIKWLINYIDTYIVTLQTEYHSYDVVIPPTSREELVAELFDLYESLKNQDMKYAGMIAHLWIGFGLCVDSTGDSNMKKADTKALDSICPNWRNIVNIETKSYSVGTGEDATTSSYQIYRLDYDKTMALPPRVLIPILGMFITSDMQEVSHCEYDDLIIFIIIVVLTYYGAYEVAEYMGTAWATAYVALSIVAYSGVGSKDFQMAVRVALIAIGGYAGYSSMVSTNFSTLAVLGFSVNLSSNLFSLYTTYDIDKRNEKIEDKKEQVAMLEREYDLAGTQDRILEYIYEEQYTNMYDKFYSEMYENDSPFYLGGYFV